MASRARKDATKVEVAAKPVPIRKGTAKSLDVFRNLYDKSVIVPAKLRAGLAKLINNEDGGPGYEEDAVFLKSCGLRPQDVTPFLEQFAEYIVMVPQNGHQQRKWAQTPEFAAKLREFL